MLERTRALDCDYVIVVTASTFKYLVNGVMKTVVFIVVWIFCCFNPGKEDNFSLFVGTREKENNETQF